MQNVAGVHVYMQETACKSMHELMMTQISTITLSLQLCQPCRSLVGLHQHLCMRACALNDILTDMHAQTCAYVCVQVTACICVHVLVLKCAYARI